jgi:hypothetical protein
MPTPAPACFLRWRVHHAHAGEGVQQALPGFEETLDELVRHIERGSHAIS